MSGARAFVGDGTTAQQHWDSPLSGAEVAGRRGMDPDLQQPRHAARASAASFCYSRQFPDDVQGQFIYACVINMNGMPRFKIHDRVGRLRRRAD